MLNEFLIWPRFKRVLESDDASVHEMIITGNDTVYTSVNIKQSHKRAVPCLRHSHVRTRPSRRSNPCSAVYYRNIHIMQTRNLVKTKLSIPHEYRCHQNSLRFSVGSYYTIVIRKQSRLLLKAEFQSEFQLELLKKSTALCFNDKIPTWKIEKCQY